MSVRVVKTRVALGDGDIDGLAPAERTAAERLQLTPHRRIEWCGGRRAARAALEGLLGEKAARGLAVVQAPDGAPIVEGASVLVSLSHGRLFAVAAAGNVTRLGIDLCEIARAPNVRHVSERFLHADERALPKSDAEWALLWALKEAAAKALRQGLFSGGLAASRVASLTEAAFAYPALTVEVEISDEDAVAVVYD